MRRFAVFDAQTTTVLRARKAYRLAKRRKSAVLRSEEIIDGRSMSSSASISSAPNRV
jgi:hypothetical protein